MEKDSGRSVLSFFEKERMKKNAASGVLFFYKKSTLNKRRKKMKKGKKAKVIATRKKCKARGTGLSHYIMVKE